MGSVHLMPFDSGGLYYPENHAMNSLEHVLQMEGNGTRGAGTIEWRGVIRFSPSFWRALGCSMYLPTLNPPLLMKSA